jgi:hypothetical protein
MRRREFIAALGSAAAWPVGARGQQPAMPVIGFLDPGPARPNGYLTLAFRLGLAEAGYVRGHRVNPKHPPGPPMDLANMRRQGVHHLIAYCLNDSCRHQALINVSSYPADTPVPWFGTKAKCAKCGALDVRPNWKEKPGMPQDWMGRPAGE